MIGLHLVDEGVVTLVHDQVQRGVTEDREPTEREQCGHEHHADDELAYGPSAADLGDEQAHEGGPGDGPAKDEQGPVADPVAARVGLQIEGAFYDMVQVTARVLQETLEDMHSGAHAEHKQHQCHRQHHVEDGQPLHTLVHTCHHRENRQGGDGDNGDDLYGHAHRNLRPEVVDTGVDLRNGEPQRGGYPEHGAEYGEDIDRVPDGTINAVADQGVQCGADRQRQSVAKGEVGQHQPHQPVDCPDVEAPVEKGDLHGLPGRIHGLRRTRRGR